MKKTIILTLGILLLVSMFAIPIIAQTEKLGVPQPGILEQNPTQDEIDDELFEVGPGLIPSNPLFKIFHNIDIQQDITRIRNKKSCNEKTKEAFRFGRERLEEIIALYKINPNHPEIKNINSIKDMFIEELGECTEVLTIDKELRKKYLIPYETRQKRFNELLKDRNDNLNIKIIPLSNSEIKLKLTPSEQTILDKNLKEKRLINIEKLTAIKVAVKGIKTIKLTENQGEN